MRRTVALGLVFLTIACMGSTQPSTAWQAEWMVGTVFYGRSELFLERSGGFYTADDFGLKFWNAEGQLQFAISPRSLYGTSVYGFSPSGQLWAEADSFYDSAGNLQTRLRLGERLRTLEEHPLPVSSFSRGQLALSDDGIWVAFAYRAWSGETTLLVGRRANGTFQLTCTVPLPEFPLVARIAPAGRFWIGASSQTLMRVDLQTGALQLQEYNSRDTSLIAMSPRGEYIAHKDINHVLRVWRTDDAAPILEIELPDGFRILRIAVSETYLVAVTELRLRVWRLDDGALVVNQMLPYCWLSSVGVSDDCVMLICPERFVEFQMPSLQVRELPYVPFIPFSVSVASQGGLMVACLDNSTNYNRVIELRRLSDGALVDYPVPTTGVTHAAISPHGRWLTLQEGSATLRVYDVLTGSPLFHTRVHESLDWRIFNFSVDNRYLLSGLRQLRAFRTAPWSLQCVIDLSPYAERRIPYALVPYTDWLWECDNDGLYQWNLATGQLMRVLPFDEAVQEAGKTDFVVTADGRLGVVALGNQIAAYDLLQGSLRWLTSIEPRYTEKLLLDPYERWVLAEVRNGVLVVRLADGAVLNRVHLEGRFPRLWGIRDEPPGMVVQQDTVVALYRLPDSRRQGDANLDGCVNEADLLEVLFAFGDRGPARVDVNADGRIDDADLLLVLFNFGEGCP